ncbi:glycoside hydrolase family 31 [Nonomuraea sp. NN258]|uniref:glycoside hydrolase family 31 protein n=1 Tax=Nonomuraea antri TaxID=2730852 RepID=UPI001567CA94|nr:TIM-barrel domain-containing protein [Nonomuraea antri]NRQ32454.1 glycoside hydrolase family 31 [Nonomuraea antri]
MITHRPYGSGHPYADTQDQRLPVTPLDGQPVELRVRAAGSVRAVTCQWRVDGRDAAELTLARAGSGAEAAEPGQVDGGHLAAAQARAARAASGSWSVTTPPLHTGHRYSYRFVATNDAGARRTSRWFDVTAANWHDHGGKLTTRGADRIVADSVRWLADGDGVLRGRFAMELAPGAHVVGFGERFDSVDQRGRSLDAVVFEQYKSQGAHGRTYLPMPFAIVVDGGRSWGFHVATSRRTWYDVGDTLTVEAEAEGDEVNVTFYEGSPAQILDAFLDDVGRPAELPGWVFRLWASGNEWNTQARVMAEMDAHREHDIPVGALVIEAWSDESTFTAFRGAQYEPGEEPHTLAHYTFPADGPWPDPKGMVDELHERDIKVLLWQIPLQKMRPHPTHQAAVDARQLLERGYGVREADGRPYRNRGWWFPLALMPDLSSPEVRDWWTAKRRYLVEEVGIDGFKTDGGEHAWGHDLRYADGRDGAAGNGLFPVHYARAFGDLLRACGKAPVTFSRAGFAGSQPHGAFWAGDEDSTWEAFRSSIRAGITASACGIVYWGWDLAGFSGPVPDAELYLRAAGTSAFMPIMQYHSEFNHHRTPPRDRTPWNIAEQTGDERVIPLFRSFAELRERLVPYLTGEAAKAVRGGAPLMRGLFFDHPGDEAIWAHPLQYKLGDALLVVPVTEPGADQVEAYLPEGEWVDVWTGRPHRGGRVLALAAPLDRPPVLCLAERWPDLAAVFST